MRSLRLALLPTIIALALLVAIPLSAQGTGPAFVWQAAIPGAVEVKFPHLAATGATVHLAANINRVDASYWSKADTATSFGSPLRLGPAEEQPDYSTTSITSGPDGKLYYAWVNQPQNTIYLRVKAPGQDWGETRTVSRGQTFPVFPEVAVTSDNTIYVVWRNPDRPFVYASSRDSGATWTPARNVADVAGINTAAIAAGPNGALAVAFAAGENDRLQIFVSQWNGSAFSTRRITTFAGDYADPGLSFAPDGRLYVAWRGIPESGTSSGVFFAERQADGSFPIARLIGGAVAGRVSILADAQQNLHVLWTGSSGGTFQLWYTVKPRTGSWANPVAAPAATGTIFNALAAISTGTDGAISANAVSEVFVGSQVTMRAYRFSSGLMAGATQPSPTTAPPSATAVPPTPTPQPPTATPQPSVAARPILAGGAATTRSSTVPVTFADVVGAPAQVRANWGGAPTDANSWQTYTGSLSVDTPALQNAQQCQELTLSTQVRNAAGVLQAQPLSDSILLDRAVQATVYDNPVAAPGYTNKPEIKVLVDGSADCSGLASARIAGSTTTAALTNDQASLIVAIPDVEGEATGAVELADGIGNSGTMSVTVVYDKTPPQAIYGAPLALEFDPRGTILQTLRLQGALYRDASGNPWGLAIAVSRQPIPTTTTPQWAAIHQLDASRTTIVPKDSGLVSVGTSTEVYLTDLLPRAQVTPGTYYFAVALVDKAGNPATVISSRSVTIEKVLYPPLFLPLLRG